MKKEGAKEEWNKKEKMALMCSSQWDGEYEPVVKARTPVYFVIGESDEHYTSKSIPSMDA